MSSWQSLHYLNLLWLLFPLIALFVFAHWRRKSMLLRFANPCQTERLAKSASAPARFFRATLFLLACAAIILALARPSWNKSHQPFKAKGRDVVFILDISRSMLAAHRNTTRLEEAKFAIQECLSTVRGDRVALIIFAGNAKVACPLTHDYAAFLAKHTDVDDRSVTFGGTMLGDAIRLACSSIFKTRAQLYRDVIVITDGEDMESNPVQAAEQLAELNARLIIVGMGDSTPSPLRITTPDGGTETIMDNGKPVMTRLDIDTLQKMTEATTGGILIPVPSDTMLNLNDIYSKYIEQQVKKDFETHSVITYEEKYQLFLVMAMVLLTIMILIPERRRLAVTAGIALLFAALPVSAENAMPREAVHLINQAKRQMEANDLEAAKESLAKSLELQADNPLAIYNRAAIDYLQGNYQEAQNGFQQALTLAQAQELDYPDFQEKVNLAIASCAFRLSQKEDNQNPQPDAERAVKYFKNALDCNPQNLTTKDNLNTAKLNYKAIRQKLKQQQQQQSANGNDGKQQDNKEDDSQNEGNNAQNAQKQNQESNENKEGDNQKNEQQKALEDLEQQQRQAASDLK
ncbi:MAG: VWA domain-containing protein, partial [Victivallales bacterium]|nr:VWA domain-containing protein [Victivallales bacterium]